MRIVLTAATLLAATAVTALAQPRAVTVDDVRAVASVLLEVTPTLAVIGPFDADRDFSSAVAS